MTQDTNTLVPPSVGDSALHYPPLQLPDSLMVPAVEEPQEYLLFCDDSITAHYAVTNTASRPSLFHGSIQSRPESMPRPRPHEANTDWIFGIIILLVLLISIHINAQRYKLKDLLMSLFDIRVRDRVWREYNIRIWTLLPTTGIFLAAIAFVMFYLIDQYNLVTYSHAPLLYLMLTGTLFAFVLLKHGLVRMLGSIFEDRESTLAYITNNHLFYFVGSLMLTPLLLLMFYGTSPMTGVALKIAIAILTIIFIIRVLRGLQLFLTNSRSAKLYLFYYLCILEIAPILVMAKIFIL